MHVVMKSRHVDKSGCDFVAATDDVEVGVAGWLEKERPFLGGEFLPFER